MNDDVGAPGGEGAVEWLIALLIVVAIVLLVLFARGPEDQERAAAMVSYVAALIAA